jgi:hypothetical protein
MFATWVAQCTAYTLVRGYLGRQSTSAEFAAQQLHQSLGEKSKHCKRLSGEATLYEVVKRLCET